MQNNPSYFDYYDRLIQHEETGFKLVIGGTGLGKTSAIAKVVTEYQLKDRKFIYCANRIQLLNEMAEKLDENQYVFLRRDTETVSQILHGANRNTFYQLLQENTHILKLAERVNRSSKLNRIDVASVQRACHRIETTQAELGNSKFAEELISSHTRVVMNFFRRILSEAAKSTKKGKNSSVYEELINDEIVQLLFPFIAFKLRPQVKLLLLTIQKAFYGFFDGRVNVNLTQLTGRNGKNVVFLDEFDFLEPELISLICSSPQIDDPFRFVELFYSAMKRHKLPLAEYPIEEGIRKHIESIVETIDELRTQGIHFPEINQFTCQMPEKKVAIFQTSHTLVNGDLYLHETNRSFEIVNKATDDSGNKNLKAIRLFNAINTASANILYLFKEIEGSAPIVYREMIRHCFSRTEFALQLDKISQLPHRRRGQSTRFDTLLDAGFGLYDIQDLQQETDKDEVEFKHYSIYLTPEKILSSLAQNNLVFGLSATADITRCVRNFDADWLRKQEGLNYFEIDQKDEHIIQSLNAVKQEHRANQIRLVDAPELEDDNVLHDKFKRFIKGIARDKEFGGDDHEGYRRKRVERFFATLLWLCKHKRLGELSNDTHLMFFNTFAQIKHVFKHHQVPEDSLFKVTSLGNDVLFDVYEIEMQGTAFIVIFYNSDQAKKIQSTKEAKEQYQRLFWRGLPVLLVTQYPSTGNGVNLQYLPNADSDEEKDFINIHLLDAPYYYFGTTEREKTPKQNDTIIKQNIWYQAKLFESKIISESRFKEVLANIHTADLSARYKNDPSTVNDALLNQMAAFIQALGRIERVWSAMPDQNVFLSREIYHSFQIFCTRPQYEYLLKQRQSIISNNLQQIFEQVAAQTLVDEKQMRRRKDETLADMNERCTKSVEILLGKLREVRLGNGDAGAKRDWAQLRIAALKHDFHNKLLKEYQCLFKTEYFYKGVLHINRNLELFPREIRHSDIFRWNLDSVYSVVATNVVIRQYFESMGYELGFNNTTKQFFVPYFYQAILVGAIGEEGIRAILRAMHIPLEPIEDRLFELADLKIQGAHWYLDCKNYSERTLENFSLPADDPQWRPKLNEKYFKSLAQQKLNEIKQFHSGENNCKLIYLNLMGHDERLARYFDSAFNPVDEFKNAEIVIIQGIVKREDPNEFSRAFESFIYHLNATFTEQF